VKLGTARRGICRLTRVAGRLDCSLTACHGFVNCCKESSTDRLTCQPCQQKTGINTGMRKAEGTGRLREWGSGPRGDEGESSFVRASTTADQVGGQSAEGRRAIKDGLTDATRANNRLRDLLCEKEEVLSKPVVTERAPQIDVGAAIRKPVLAVRSRMLSTRSRAAVSRRDTEASSAKRR